MKDLNRIIVGYGKVKEIAELFDVTEAMVSKALRGKSSTKLADKIRYAAINNYGGQKMQLVSTRGNNENSL
ncbi:MAG TPA: hypothetical protein PK500_01020 [Candidatus Egerieousia sp.]|nr:hypothetical protein [Candidatus Egerieousia sp.]